MMQRKFVTHYIIHPFFKVSACCYLAGPGSLRTQAGVCWHAYRLLYIDLLIRSQISWDYYNTILIVNQQVLKSEPRDLLINFFLFIKVRRLYIPVYIESRGRNFYDKGSRPGDPIAQQGREKWWQAQSEHVIATGNWYQVFIINIYYYLK